MAKNKTTDTKDSQGFEAKHAELDAQKEQEDDSDLFDAKMQRLVARLREQHAEAANLDAAIAANPKELGYGG